MKIAVGVVVMLAMAMATHIAIDVGGYWIVGSAVFLGLLITMGVVSWNDGAPLVVWAAYIFALALVGAVAWPIIPNVVLVVGWRRSREISKPSDEQPGPDDERRNSGDR
jgi:hypothetical protein